MPTAFRRMRLPALAILLVFALGGMATAACGDNSSGVGNACESDDDCETDNCYQGPGGGYCTTECDDEGSVDQCPEDTVCKPIQGGPARCLLVCGSNTACNKANGCSDDACPDGSSCTDVSNTDRRACEPNPN